MFKLGSELKIGDKIICKNGEIFTISKIVQGDKSPFGKIGKFWHLKPLTIYDKKDYGVIAPSDKFEII